MFERVTLFSDKAECISIFMGKLGSYTHYRIPDAYGVDNLSFENLVAYFRKHEEQVRFEGLAKI